MNRLGLIRESHQINTFLIIDLLSTKVCFISYKLINNEPSEKLLLKQPWF